MIADRQDVAAPLKLRHQQKIAEVIPLAKILAGAAPVMHELQVDERWTKYQQIVQGLIERWKQQREVAKERLGMSGLADAELRKLNTDVLSANAAISAWELALKLPRAIADGGEEATRFVEEFEKQNETSSKP